MALEGLFLCDTAGTSWYFREGEPEAIRYRLDKVTEKGAMPSVEKRESYQKKGWKYLLTHKTMYHIFQAKDPVSYTHLIRVMKDLKRILKFTRPYRLDFSLAIFFVVIETSFELIIPMIMAGILDVGVAGRDLNYIFSRGGLMAACSIISLGTGLLYARYSCLLYTSREGCGGGGDESNI